jgi:hypothetical protein
MSNICYYALSGINYKNEFSTVCPINSERLVYFDETILPSEIYKHENLNRIRRELYNGNWPEGCHLCEELELNKTHSMRNDRPFDGKKFSHELKSSCFDHFDIKTGKMSPLGCRHIELRFSNSCNMSCLHCSSVYSTGWGKILENYIPDEETKKYELLQLTNEYHNTDDRRKSKLKLTNKEVESICNDLNKNFPNIDRIEFSGGEVLIQKQFFLALEILAKHPNKDNIFLSFYSNFNVEVDYTRLTELLRPFKYSIITVSVDGGKNIYSYFRNGNWEKLKNNIINFRKINNFTELSCVNTFSAYQFMDLQNTFESLFELDFRYIKISLVQTPEYLNPSILAFDFHDELLSDFNDVFKIIDAENKKRKNDMKNSMKLNSSINSRFSNFFRNENKNQDRVIFSDLESAKHQLNSVKNYIFNKKVTSYKNYNRFLIYIKKTDELMNKDFNKHFDKFRYIDGELMRKR